MLNATTTAGAQLRNPGHYCHLYRAAGRNQRGFQ